jgi:hypothetical protein
MIIKKFASVRLALPQAEVQEACALATCKSNGEVYAAKKLLPWRESCCDQGGSCWRGLHWRLGEVPATNCGRWLAAASVGASDVPDMAKQTYVMHFTWRTWQNCKAAT